MPVGVVLACPDTRCTINFLLISGIVKRERKILKGGEEETREEEGCKGGGGDGWMDGIAVPRA